MAFLAPIAGVIGSIGSVVAPILTVAGTVASIGAGMAQAKYQQQVAQNQAKVAEVSAFNQAQAVQANINASKTNEALATRNAERAAEAGRVAAQEQSQMARGLLGEQLAVQAASGLSLNSGSFLRTRKTARMLGQQDARRAQAAGDVEAANYRQEAANFGTNAANLGIEKQNVLMGGSMDAANAIASGQMAKSQARYDAISTGISGLGNFISLIGNASPTKTRFNSYQSRGIYK